MNPVRTITLLGAVTMALFVPLIALLIFALTMEERPDPPVPPRVFQPAWDEGPEPVVVDPPPEARVPAPRELAVAGWAYDSDQHPLEGARIRLEGTGEEAVVGADGSFGLPARARPPTVGLVVAKGGRELARFDRVVTSEEGTGSRRRNDAARAADEAEEIEETDGGRPALASISWSVNVLGGPDQTARVGDGKVLWIRATHLLFEDWGSGGRVQVHGLTGLPGGAHVYCNLDFDGFRLVGTVEPSEVRDGAWAVRLAVPESVRIYAGRHEIVSSFNSLLESYELVEAWRASSPGGMWDEVREVTDSRMVFLGDRSTAAAQDRSVEEYCRGILRDATRLYRGFTSRVEELTNEGQGWNPELLENRRLARSAWFGESFIDESGGLDVDRWRRYVDEEWRAEVRALLNAHRERVERKYTEAESRVDGLLNALLTMSRIYSLLFVYPLFQLPPHPNDAYIDEGGGQMDLGLIRSVIEENLHHLQRFTSLTSP